VLQLARDLDPLLPGVLPELLDPAFLRGGPLRRTDPVTLLGRRDPADHENLVAIDTHLRLTLEPSSRQPTSQPPTHPLTL
jgi:hypothetical protein